MIPFWQTLLLLAPNQKKTVWPYHFCAPVLRVCPAAFRYCTTKFMKAVLLLRYPLNLRLLFRLKWQSALCTFNAIKLIKSVLFIQDISIGVEGHCTLKLFFGSAVWRSANKNWDCCVSPLLLYSTWGTLFKEFSQDKILCAYVVYAVVKNINSFNYTIFREAIKQLMLKRKTQCCTLNNTPWQSTLVTILSIQFCQGQWELELPAA